MKTTQTIGWNQSATKVYNLRVSALGYEDVVVPVKANTKALALGTNNRLMAIGLWEEHNDVEDCAGLPSVRIES